MGTKRLHLISPAGSCRSFLPRLGLGTAGELIAYIQKIVDPADTPSLRVTGDEALIDADENDEHGGRADDQARAAAIEAALGDSDVVVVVMLRGGAWFTRILPRIDFSVLDRRASRLAVFGFSELTPLINIVANHRNGVGLYALGPVFLGYGLKRYAAVRAAAADGTADDRYEGHTPREWMRQELPGRFAEYFRECVATIEGQADPPPIRARLVRGRMPDDATATIVGGNLTVLSVMIGSRYRDAIEPTGRWLLLEDYNDKPGRFDRYLAHLTLAGFWERCAGVLLGDFHQQERDLTPAMVRTIEHHLPDNTDLPVAVTDQVGHIWPMTPVPLHLPSRMERTADDELAFHWTRADLAVSDTRGSNR